MRKFKLLPLLAPLALIILQFAAPTQAHADSYSIVGLGIDNVSFYGLSNNGQVVFENPFVFCGGGEPCYGHPGSWSSAVPSLTWDNGTPCSPSLPAGTSDLASVCNNGNVAFYGHQSGNYGVEGVYSGTTSPQLIATGFFTGPLYLNSVGDIVFDNGGGDEWYEAIDLSTTPAVPEPSALLLLSTGIAAFAGFGLYRRNLLHN